MGGWPPHTNQDPTFSRISSSLEILYSVHMSQTESSKHAPALFLRRCSTARVKLLHPLILGPEVRNELPRWQEIPSILQHNFHKPSFGKILERSRAENNLVTGTWNGHACGLSDFEATSSCQLPAWEDEFRAHLETDGRANPDLGEIYEGMELFGLAFLTKSCSTHVFSTRPYRESRRAEWHQQLYPQPLQDLPFAQAA